MFAKALSFLPPWVPFAVAGALLLALVGAGFTLKASWQAEGAAKVAAAVNGASLAAYSDQEARNQVIDAKLDKL